jgi:hypothetical protein
LFVRDALQAGVYQDLVLRGEHRVCDEQTKCCDRDSGGHRCADGFLVTLHERKDVAEIHQVHPGVIGSVRTHVRVRRRNAILHRGTRETRTAIRLV